MTVAAWFWILFVLGILFNGYTSFRQNGDRAGGIGSLILILLLGLLGYAVFASPLR